MFNITFFALQFINLTDEVHYTLRIIDRNNQIPTFEAVSFQVSISEDRRGGNHIPIPLATDSDEGNNTVQNYSLTPTFDGKFGLEIRRQSGFIEQVRLTQNAPLDRELYS